VILWVMLVVLGMRANGLKSRDTLGNAGGAGHESKRARKS
jgi:hypothetical protein